MAKINKTNAIRILDSKKIKYSIHSYDSGDGLIDGVSAASKIGKNVYSVYKTLVTQGHSGEFYVFVIPVTAELDLKKAASAAGEKKIDMISVKNIFSLTGYIRGGCSPVGMKKLFRTFLDSSAEQMDSIVVSGGKIGIQIETSPYDLLKTVDGELSDLVKT